VSSRVETARHPAGGVGHNLTRNKPPTKSQGHPIQATPAQQDPLPSTRLTTKLITPDHDGQAPGDNGVVAAPNGGAIAVWSYGLITGGLIIRCLVVCWFALVRPVVVSCGGVRPAAGESPVW
jgi:hypothetical protein